jgi:hypothetical protein
LGTGLFYRVILDEAHKSKSRSSTISRWMQALAPAHGYAYLTATPMPNNISGMVALLKLNWNPDWADDTVFNLDYPRRAIGMLADEPELEAQPDQRCHHVKAVLDPTLFFEVVQSRRQHGLRHGNSHPFRHSSAILHGQKYGHQNQVDRRKWRRAL